MPVNVEVDLIVGGVVLVVSVVVLIRALLDTRRHNNANAMLARDKVYKPPAVLPEEELRVFTRAELLTYNGIDSDSDDDEEDDDDANGGDGARGDSVGGGDGLTQRRARKREKRPQRPVYVCVRRVVYDVTPEADLWYRPGCCYHCFAGRVATRGLALVDLHTTDWRHTEADLTPAQRAKLEEWIAKYQSKYTIVGSVLEEDDDDI